MTKAVHIVLIDSEKNKHVVIDCDHAIVLSVEHITEEHGQLQVISTTDTSEAANMLEEALKELKAKTDG